MSQEVTGNKIVATLTEEKFDFVVMASHGRTGLDALVHGSTALAVLQAGAVPVLLVPPAS